MSKQRKLNHGAETVAVTSFLSFTYLPIKTSESFPIPTQMQSKNGKLDTSRKFYNVGGATSQYKFNNDYASYGAYLKKIHKNKKNVTIKDVTLNKNDDRKADKTVEKVPLIVAFKPSAKKNYEYRRKRKEYNYDANYFLNVSKPALQNEEIDDAAEVGGFWTTETDPLVQGLDASTQIPEIKKRLERYKELETISKMDVVGSSSAANDLPFMKKALIRDLNNIEHELQQFKDFLIMSHEDISKLRVVIKGATFSAAQRVLSNTNLVMERALSIDVDNINATVANVNRVTSNCDTIMNWPRDIYESIVAYASSILTALRQIMDQILSFVVSDEAMAHWITAALLYAAVWLFVQAMGLDYSNVQIAAFIGALILPRVLGLLVSPIISSITQAIIMSTNTDHVRVRSDSNALSLLFFLASGLVGVTGKPIRYEFIQSIRSSTGIFKFSDKFDSIMRIVYDTIPDTIKVYTQYYAPAVYEYIQLKWYDLEFQKDFMELRSIVDKGDAIFYSSHYTHQFIYLYEKFRNNYIAKYGNYTFFQECEEFDKMDQIYESMANRGLVIGKRHTPFVIWIGGDSGVGKSTLALLLARSLTEPGKSMESQVYTWNPLLPYQDGYNNQPIVIVNDYMQTVDNAEEQLLISMKDSCDWYLNPSAIDNKLMGNKGEVRFTSRVVIITSNITHLHTSNSIREIKAFNRRRDIVLQVRFKQDRVNDPLSTTFDWADFFLVDPISENQSVQPFEYNNLTRYIKQKMEQYHQINCLRMNMQLPRVQADDDVFYEGEGQLRSAIKAKLRSIKVTFLNILDSIYESRWKYFLLGSGLLGITFFSVKVVNWLFSSRIGPRSFNSGDENTLKHLHPLIKKKIMTQSLDILADPVIKKTKNNLFRITTNILVDKRPLVRSVNCLYMGNDRILCPKHVFFRAQKKITSSEQIFFTRGDLIFESFFSEDRYEEIDSDMVLYRVDYILPKFKNIVSLVDDDGGSLKREGQAIALALSHDGKDIAVHSFQYKCVPRLYYYDDVNNQTQKYEGTNLIQFNSPLSFGDCGTPILTLIGGNYKIIAIHVSGRDVINYAQLVNKSKISNHQHKDIVIKGLDEEIEYGRNNQILYLGKMDPTLVPYANTKTAISPSCMYGILQEPITAPCVLSPLDKRNVEHISPLAVGTELSGKVVWPIERKYYSLILAYMYKLHRNMFKDYRILTELEAINGIEGLERLDMSTSPGYPYTIQNKTKKDFFKLDNDVWKPTNFYVEQYRKFIDEAIECNQLPLVWTNCVKDERKPLEKILSSRIFTVSNIIFTVLGRRIFGNYVASYIQYRSVHGGMIGINPYSSEWNDLYNRLNCFSNANDGDYSKFDKDVLKEIFEIFAIFVKNLIPDGEFEGKTLHWWIDRILETTLFSKTLTIVGQYPNFEKVLIQTLHGNPSGWFLTVFFNDFANKVYMFMAWCHLTADYSPLSIDNFLEHTRFAYYGDDNLYTVSDKYCDIYNASTISETLLDRYNIIYKSGDKGDAVKYNRKLEDCLFLKNHFIIMPSGICQAGLEKSVIQEMVSWTKDNDESLAMIVETCLRFAYFWGEDYFNWVRNKLSAFTQCPIYSELDYYYSFNNKLSFNIFNKRMFDEYENLQNKLCIMENKCLNETVKSPLVVVQSTTVVAENGLRVEQSVRETVKNYGTVLANQNVNAIERSNIIYDKTTIPEVPSDLKTLLSRPTLVYNSVIGAGTLASITTITLPSSWLAAAKTVSNTTNNYFFFRGKFMMQITLRSTPYNSGLMLVSPCYKEISSFMNLVLDEPTNMYARGATELDYSDNSINKIIEIPWRYKRTYCDFKSAGIDNMVDVYFANMVANSAAAQLTVHVWLENAEVVVTRVAAQGITLFGDVVTNTSITEQIEHVEGNVIPSNLIGDKYDLTNNLSLSALDNPNLPLEATRVIVKREGTTSNADQVTQIEKLGMYPKQQITADFGTFGTNEDEMSIDFLKSRWSVISSTAPGSQTITYNTTSAGFLAAYNVGPFTDQSYHITARGSNQYMNMVDYISKNHLLWKGSSGPDGMFDFRFKAVTNRFQSGQIAIVWNPGATWFDMFGTWSHTGLTFSVDKLASCYTTYFDLNGEKSDIIVRLPYISQTPWKRVFNGNNKANDNRFQIYKECYCGVLLVYAITPLYSPAGSPTSTTIIPLIRGAPGYKIAVYCDKNNGIGGKVVPPPLMINDNATDEETTTLRNRLLRVRVQSKDEVIFLGEQGVGQDDDGGILPTTSIRDCCRRYTRFIESSRIFTLALLNGITEAGQVHYCFRLFTNYIIPAIPLYPWPKITVTTPITAPEQYNYYSIYQAFVGGAKMRIRATVKRNDIKDDATTGAYGFNSYRPTEGYRVIVYLSQVHNGVDRSEDVVFPAAIKFTNTTDGLATLPPGANAVFANCQPMGQILMDVSFNDVITSDVEIPIETWNKYNEVYDSTVSPTTQISESRPTIGILIYKDVTTALSALPAAGDKWSSIESVQKSIRNMYSQIEVFWSFADNMRFGVFSEYPYYQYAGTDQYSLYTSNRSVVGASQAIPFTTYTPVP